MNQREIITSIHGRKMGFGPKGEVIINHEKDYQSQLGLMAVKKITSAQLLALNATPREIIPAPGAGLFVMPLRMAIHKPAGVAYGGIATGEDLVLKYTNGSGAQCSGVVETTGFLDQTTAQTRVVGMPGSTGATAADYAPVANAAVVLHLLTGEITTGDSDLYVRVWYEIHKQAFTVEF